MWKEILLVLVAFAIAMLADYYMRSYRPAHQIAEVPTAEDDPS